MNNHSFSDALTAFEVHDLTVSYRHKPVLWGVDFTVPKGARMAIVGPNGAGKSTLLKAAVGIVKPDSGVFRIFGEMISKKKASLAYVPQREEVDWDFPVTVQDVVEMGCYATLSTFQRFSPAERERVERALAIVELSDLKNRVIRELSGGQQQRVFIARALAQEASVMILDEPFAGVDLATEKSLGKTLLELSQRGTTIIAVHHDLGTLTEYFNYAALLNLRLVAAGKIEEVCTKENLNHTYGGRLNILSQVIEDLRLKSWKGRDA
jgi:manganese/zinc/iron transport system ATP- binding protein